MAHDANPGDRLPDYLLKEVLSPIFPGLRIGNVDCIQIRSFQHQLFHLRVRFEGNAPPEELFFRLYAGNFSWWELSSDLRTKEEEAFTYVNALGFTVPEFILRSENPPIAITRRVPGFPVAERLSSDSVANVAACLAALHSRSAASPPPAGSFPDLSLAAIFRRLRSWSEECADEAILELVNWAERGLSGAKETSGFVHGDCNAKNFLSTPAGIVMLDLEECGVGDPRIDLATMLTNLPREGGFNARAHFIRAYECASGRAVGPLEAWMNLIDVRDIITARVVEARQSAGKEIPRFNSSLWSQYARELYPNVRRRMEGKP